MKGKHVVMNFSKKFQQLSEQETAKQLKKNFREVITNTAVGSTEHSAGREKYEYVDKFFKIREVDLTKLKSNTPQKSLITRLMEMESIRFTRFEGTYKWWKTLPPDVRNAIIPVFLSFLFGAVIYNSSNFLIERQDRIVLKAQTPEYINDETFKKWQAGRNQNN